MNYDTFSQLWNELVTDRSNIANDAARLTNGMSEKTACALIEYGEGNKSKIEAERAYLASIVD